ncbi:hypothetical protein HMPREF3204_00827 [Gardnerella pickettii]|nr:hypothetical protein HMPREF3204_00827 [Gardnerella pickettii]
MDFTQDGSLSKLKKYYSFESRNTCLLSKVKNTTIPTTLKEYA